MLSYEDIFKRHRNPRPLSYLDSYLDSPITRIPVPVILRSPVLYKERRRPTSVACLDGISRSYNETYRLPSKDTTPSTFSNNPRPVLRDITPRFHSESYRPTPKDSSRFLNDSPKPARRNDTSRFNDSPKPGPRNDTTRFYNDSFKPAPRNDTIIRNNHRYLHEEEKPRHFVDNYKHTVTFPDRHLSRRELPLCTPDDLLDIIREPTGYYALPTDPWNEVYPDIYLSDAPTALCTNVLKRIGITHVLNAAQGKEKGCGQVNTSPAFYSQSGIQFLGVPAFDNIVFRLYPYFEQAAQFIEDGLKSKGKVLVHCRAGISRSATLVCAFLMLKRGLTAQEAVKTVRKNRAIIPNDGFLQQLCDLNDRLKQKSRV